MSSFKGFVAPEEGVYYQYSISGTALTWKYPPLTTYIVFGVGLIYLSRSRNTKVVSPIKCVAKFKVKLK